MMANHGQVCESLSKFWTPAVHQGLITEVIEKISAMFLFRYHILG